MEIEMFRVSWGAFILSVMLINCLVGLLGDTSSDLETWDESLLLCSCSNRWQLGTEKRQNISNWGSDIMHVLHVMRVWLEAVSLQVAAGSLVDRSGVERRRSLLQVSILLSAYFHFFIYLQISFDSLFMLSFLWFRGHGNLTARSMSAPGL